MTIDFVHEKNGLGQGVYYSRQDGKAIKGTMSNSREEARCKYTRIVKDLLITKTKNIEVLNSTEI